MERTLLCGKPYKRKLLSTKITSDQAKALIAEFEKAHPELTNPNIKKVS